MKKIFLIFFSSIFLFVGCGEENIVEESYTEVNTESGRLTVIVKNEESFVADIQVIVDFYDKEDNIIDTAYEQLVSIEAGMEVPIVIYNEPEEYDDYKINVTTYESTVKNMVDELELTEKFENNIIYGEIKNNSDELVETVSFSISYYKDDEIIHVIDSIVEDIAAGEVGTFEFAIPIDKDYNFIDYDKYEVDITGAYSQLVE